jgi:hypothetical protein
MDTSTWVPLVTAAAGLAAGPQSHSEKLTTMRPGPHSCPLERRSG